MTAVEMLARPGLSCHTAALAGYLEAEWPSRSRSHVASSVQLAVATGRDDGLLEFSHHTPSLDLLPDGTWLEYAWSAAPDTSAFEGGLNAQLAAYGRSIVVVDAAALPWSVASVPNAPHWLLVTNADADSVQVLDAFTALYEGGPQQPFRGTITRGALLAAAGSSAWQPEQVTRTAMVFGIRVQVPPPGALAWLRRRSGTGPARIAEPACLRWQHGDVAVLTVTGRWLRENVEVAERHLPDLWALAGHRAVAMQELASSTRTPASASQAADAAQAWTALPRWAQFSVESALRGRPRWGVFDRGVETALATTALANSAFVGAAEQVEEDRL